MNASQSNSSFRFNRIQHFFARSKKSLKTIEENLPVKAVMPDGLFSDHKFQFWLIFVCLGMENVGTIYGHCGTFKSLWCILPPFGIFCGNLV
jgi:hypothetical protein